MISLWMVCMREGGLEVFSASTESSVTGGIVWRTLGSVQGVRWIK